METPDGHRSRGGTGPTGAGNSPQSELHQAKRDFLSGMSHALKTPLNAILGFSELGERATDDPTLSMYFGSIRSAGTRLLDMLTDLLDFSRAQRGEYTPSISWFSVPEFLDEFISAWQSDADSKGLQLRLVADTARWSAESDPTILRRVLGRLLSNAIEYSPEAATVQVHVDISDPAGAHEGMLTVRVVDEGSGVHETIRANLFAGLESGEHGQSRGPGLGLALSRVLLELLGGSIALESTSSEGSTFTITLPVGLRELDSSAASEARTTPSAGRSLEDLVILVADDTELNRTMLREMLSATGARLIEATNGMEAVRAAEEASIDVALLDIEMPVLDGWEAAQMLRKQHGATFPLIAVSGHNLASDPRSERFDALLQKPLDQASLLSCLQRVAPARELDDSETTDQAGLESDVGNETLSDAARFRLLSALKGSMGEIEALRSNQSITLIETFGSKMAEMALAENFEPLATWGQQLAREAAMFEIDRMNRTLTRFESIIQMLEGNDG